MVRHDNLGQSASFFIEKTFYDQINGLREEVDRLVAVGNVRKVTAHFVTEAYYGYGNVKDRTKKQTDGVIVSR